MEEEKIIKLLDDESTRREAFGQIVNQYSETLYWKIRHIVVGHDDANDVLQNTFLNAWKSLDNFRGQSKLSTWLYRIAVNESLDHLRREKKRQGTSDELTLANQLLADDYFDGDEAQALLQEAIAQLPDVQRSVFTLRYYDEMKYSEMSQVLSTTEGALKASYHIAVKKISEYVLNHSTKESSNK
jgi:RNA polymerase sigma-70 factor (ECF subfamily)